MLSYPPWRPRSSGTTSRPSASSPATTASPNSPRVVPTRGLESLGDKTLLYCKPEPRLPAQPLSCLVHGITPQYAAEAGLSDYDFAKALRGAMSAPGTTTAGFNSLQFDDEFVRNLLYRNLFDPYEREWRNGNSRWDLIDLMRAARDLRPEGIVWPEDEDGRPIFTLVALARANGISHESAHDAMHDVLATIDLARLAARRDSPSSTSGTGATAPATPCGPSSTSSIAAPSSTPPPATLPPRAARRSSPRSRWIPRTATSSSRSTSASIRPRSSGLDVEELRAAGLHQEGRARRRTRSPVAHPAQPLSLSRAR